MKAFFGKQEIKEKYLKRVKWHREMDYLIQGTGYEKDANGKVQACAVGCTLENYDHAQYEAELGVPEWLAWLEDSIFEGLDKDKAMHWPERFLSAINPGADLDKVKTPFLIYILEQNLKTLDSLPATPESPDVTKTIENCRAATVETIRCHREGLDLSAAESAAWSARSAAESAAWSAAQSAAWSAAWSARSAAESAAWSAAQSAAQSAELSARSAARSVWSIYADKLIELLSQTEVKGAG